MRRVLYRARIDSAYFEKETCCNSSFPKRALKNDLGEIYLKFGFFGDLGFAVLGVVIIAIKMAEEENRNVY